MATGEPPRRATGPFIMPDGRPLGMFLESQALRPPRGSGGHKRRPGAVREPREGWTKALPRAATAAGAEGGGGGGGHSEAEAAEMNALSRVGHRKQRRWLNDKLLRDMAGNLTASDMSSLFSPVPFGESRTTLWEQAAAPEHAVLWDLFRSLDMDRQSRVLHKWEAHVRELQAGPAAIQNPAVHAIAAWAAVSGRARQAMKRSSPAHVQAIETQILLFLQQDDPEEELVLEGLEDGFHRLIAHGLAEYHSLNSHSRVVEGGSGGEKEVVVRRRPAAAAASGSSAMAAATAAMAAAAIEEGEGAAGAAAGQQQQQAMSPQQAHQQQAAAPAVLAISCCDILHILVDEPQPLNPAVLHQAYLHPIDSSSEAGDHHTAAQRQEQLQQMLVEAA